MRIINIALIACVTSCFNNALAAQHEVGEAPCTIGDGYQTVRFDNGATYSGSFKNCRPLAGPAEIVTAEGKFSGNATPVGANSDTVVLKFSGGEVTVTVVTRQVGR